MAGARDAQDRGARHDSGIGLLCLAGREGNEALGRAQFASSTENEAGGRLQTWDQVTGQPIEFAAIVSCIYCGDVLQRAGVLQ